MPFGRWVARVANSSERLPPRRGGRTFSRGLSSRGLVEEEQQPDMADLLQAFQRFHLVERRQQFQGPPRRRREQRLARDGELSMKQERM